MRWIEYASGQLHSHHTTYLSRTARQAHSSSTKEMRWSDENLRSTRCNISCINICRTNKVNRKVYFISISDIDAVITELYNWFAIIIIITAIGHIIKSIQWRPSYFIHLDVRSKRTPCSIYFWLTKHSFFFFFVYLFSSIIFHFKIYIKIIKKLQSNKQCRYKLLI